MWMSTITYRVDGMTCGHCAQSVTREVSALDGVADVAVDLAAKTVAVTGDAEQTDVAAAVAEAGYTLVGRRDGDA
jgi:copper chaperone CopZ